MTDATEEAAPDYTLPLGKAPTALQKRFAEWIRGEEVGYDPNSAKTKLDAFNEGVRLGVALRMPYQASDHNRRITAEERAARLADREAVSRAKEATRNSTPPPTSKPAAEPAPAAAAKPAKRTAKKATPAAAATTPPPAATRPPARRAPARRPPAANAAPPVQAPF